MQKDVILDGKWCTPDNRDDEYIGILTYTQGKGCLLKLYDGIPKDNWFTKQHLPVILGKALDEKGKVHVVTLVECTSTSAKHQLGLLSITYYSCTFGFIGQHFKNIADLNFNKIRSTVADLNNWLYMPGISLTHEGETFSLNYKKPENIEFKISESLTGSFISSHNFPQNKFPWLLSVEQVSFFEIGSSSPLAFRQLLNEFFTFYKFMSFAYGVAPPIETIHVINVNDLDHTGQPQVLQVLYRGTFVNEKYKYGRNESEFLFSYQFIGNIIGSLIFKWFELVNDISPSIDILNHLLLQQETVQDVRIVQVVQALESFHNKFYSDTTDDEYKKNKKIFDEIIQSVPKHTLWLNNIVGHNLGRKLKERLSELVNRIPESISDRIGLKTEIERSIFIKSVVKTRNYYIHFSNKKHILQHLDLAKAIEKLKVILICSLLEQLAFTHDEIVSMRPVEKCYPFSL